MKIINPYILKDSFVIIGILKNIGYFSRGFVVLFGRMGNKTQIL